MKKSLSLMYPIELSENSNGEIELSQEFGGETHAVVITKEQAAILAKWLVKVSGENIGGDTE